MKKPRIIAAFMALAVILLVGSCTKEVTGVSLNKTSLELVEGAGESLTATVSPEDATDKSLDWSSSDTKVATVSGGRVTAVAPGRATITATNKASGKSASCSVTVVAKYIAVSSVTLDKSSATIAPEETLQLTATLSPSDATDKSVTWKSSDSKVATVDNSGKVTGVTEGSATITVSAADGKSATCAITVKPIMPESVKLDKSEATIAKGSDLTLTATISPANTTNKNLVWSSGNESVATVDANGKVKGVKSGVAVITVKCAADNTKKAECNITVKTYVEAVSIQSLSETEIRIGQSLTLKADVAPADADDKSVKWESSNASVISVSEDGTIKGLAEGEATITVSTNDGGKKATVTLTCRGYGNAIVYDPITGEIKW